MPPRSVRSSETPSLAPERSYKPSDKSRKSGGESRKLRCIAASEGDHLDAARLNESGIWLGDFDEENSSVNGLSQKEVERNYFDSTLGGTRCHNAEPHVFYDGSNDDAGASAETVVCAACKEDPNTPSLHLQTMVWSPNDDSEVEEQAPMRMREALIFCSKFKGRDVFAFVKELPHRECQKLGLPNTKLWSFWKIDGGYTSKALLAKASQDVPFPVLKSDLLGSDVKRKRSTTATTTTTESGDPGPSRGKPSRRRCNDVRSEDLVRHNEIQQTDREALPSHEAGQDGQNISTFHPINTSTNIPAPMTHMARNSPEIGPTRARRSSFNSMYDVSPGPGARKRQTSQSTIATRQLLPREPSDHEGSAAASAFADRPSLAINLSSNSGGSQSTSLADEHGPVVQVSSVAAPSSPKGSTSMPPPARVVQFKIWLPFKISGTTEVAAKAVCFNTAMSFEVAFTHAKSKLERQLAGRELIGMTIESKVDGRPSLLVDEEDMWGEVVRMVKETGSEELNGMVDME